MINIHCLKFDESIVEGWANPDNHDRGIGWMDHPSAPARIVMKDFNPFPLQFPCSLDDIYAVRRDALETLTNQGCGLVESDVISRSDLGPQPIKIVREIAKQPQNPKGMSYKGAIYIPMGDTNFIIRVWCFEVGVTGMRDSVIASKLAGEGFVMDPSSPDWGGWWLDEYGLGPAPIRKNLSEDAKYDQMFPDHPLSITRNLLGRIEQSLRFDPNAQPPQQSPPQQPPQNPKGKGFFGGLFGGKN